MKICVLVKEVPDARASQRIDRVTGRLDRSVESGLNSYDRHALEAAVQLRAGGRFGEAEVVAVTMGPAAAQRTLRRAVALGADRGVHLCDDAVAGSDVGATGYALSQLLRAEQPQLVLCGQQSSDAGTSALPAIIAEHLRLAVVTGASALQARDGDLVVERQSELGTQQITVTLPAVISVAPSANTPRYVSLKETIGAKGRPTQLLSCADASIDPGRVGGAGSAVICSDWHDPPLRKPGTIVQPADTAQAVALIVDWLADRKLI